MSFRIKHPGTFSLPVDRGRPGTRGLGIPIGGAADTAAYQIGNALLGNPPNAVALEMTLSGPTLNAEAEVACCVFGAPFAIQVSERPVVAGSVFNIRGGETIRIGGTHAGARGYLCVRGGFQPNPILGSTSAFEPIEEGALLACRTSSDQARSLEHAAAATLLEERSDSIRIIDGPQADWFPHREITRQSFIVTPASNRMGVRLQGTPLIRPAREMISEAVAPGAVQVTNDGQIIVLGVDGQTIGGYPKLAHVIRADLDAIGQLRPGQSIRFESVSIDEAEALANERRRKLKRWLAVLRIFAKP